MWSQAFVIKKPNQNKPNFLCDYFFPSYVLYELLTLVSVLREQAILSKQGGHFEKSSKQAGSIKQAGWKFSKNKQADIKQIG